MNAETRIRALDSRLQRAGINLSLDEVAQLRRAEKTLQRWAEQECNGDIQRDETTGKAFAHYGRGTNGPFLTSAIADREAGALKRVAAICANAGIHFYHQGDPRGCALYVAREPLTDQTYSTRGVACCD